MGQESSQVENEQGGVQQRGGKVIGPPVSPIPSERDEGNDEGRIIGPKLSPLVSDGDGAQPNPSNPTKPTKKKKRRRKSLDHGAGDEVAVAATALMARVMVPESPKIKKKNSPNSSGPNTGANGSITNIQLLAHNGHVEDTPGTKRKPKKRSKMASIAENGVPEQNGIYEQGSTSLDGGALPNGDYPEPEVLRSPQSTKKKRSKNKPNGVPSPDAQQLLVSHAVGGSPPSAQQPALNGITGHEPNMDAAIEQEVIPASEIESFASQIEPSHLKTEPDTSFDDDIEDEELPFRIADDSIVESTRGSSNQVAYNQLRQKSPFMHKREMSIVDDRADLESDDEEPIPDLQPSQVKPEPPSSESESDLGSPSVARLDRLARSRSRSVSRVPVATNPANESPGRRRPHSDVVEESDHENADQSAPPQDTVIQDIVQDVVEPVNEPVNEPEVPVVQPKKARKKRRLQSKESLSLSQLEDDFGEGESQSRVSLSQRSKLKDVMRDNNNPAEEGEPQTKAGPSQEPAKPTKAKRKRRSTNVSEDEMDNLLAGPSKRKRPKKASKSLGDGEETPSTQAKRLSQGGIATGAWTSDELNALGRVVDRFCESHDMTQSELNAVIHQRPDMNNPTHKDFWDRAVAAVQHRTRKQIQERTRRLYNNFAGRGRWTDEQKEELHELFKKHGNKYAEIAQLINRDQKDIRDYWRNNYVVFAHQRKSRWSSDETETLKQVVEEALHKIRIDRENNDQFRPRPRAKAFDDESLLDWQQISTSMGLTRNRQQCKWKWQDLKDKSVHGDDSDHLPKASRESKTINGLSEELANAREDYRGMSFDDQLQVVEAIHDSGATNDSRIRWNSLVDERFRAKWRRPTLKLVWFRLRRTVPDYEEQDVQSNARYLLNYFNNHQSLPRIEDNQADDQVEEKLVNPNPGSKVWRTPSQEPRAVRERQRRSSSASSRASSRGSQVSSQILRFEGSDDEGHREPAERGRDRTPRSGSVDLGQEDAQDAEEQQQKQQQQQSAKGKGKAKGKQKGSGKKNGEDAVPIRIPKHLKGEAAEKALAEAQAKQKAAGGGGGGKGKGTGKAKGKGKQVAKSPAPPARGARSASVALDSDSE
ncbi:RNA polymerase I enhancer binding protein [Diaporthe australafricana]|uniref:RNA polymerase I enhancer binding protein n=1 Tax=Diaporthe australafricana TaxID=127596 RepID=A0ABR3WEN3_9PEZI